MDNGESDLIADRGTEGTRPRSTPSPWLIWSVLLFALVTDVATKSWAMASLDDRDIDLVGSLRLNLVRNSGSAFRTGEGLGPLLGLIAIVVVVALFRYRDRIPGRWGAVGTGLLAGGAAGNLVDRLFRDAGWLRGSVVDFIDLQWWPVFNLADTFIVIGALILVVVMARHPEATADHRPAVG